MHCYLKSKGGGSHGDLLKKLVTCIISADLFEKDFPFYVIVAYRIKLYGLLKVLYQVVEFKTFSYSNQIYVCKDSQPFINTCIDKMETLDSLKLSSTLTTFLQRLLIHQLD